MDYLHYYSIKKINVKKIGHTAEYLAAVAV